VSIFGILKEHRSEGWDRGSRTIQGVTVNKLIFITFISLALFGCGDSNNQPKSIGQSSNQQDKNDNKPASTPQNTTSPGY
jgi:hypothetical protein